MNAFGLFVFYFGQSLYEVILIVLHDEFCISLSLKDTPTICKIWLKSKFLVYGDYFDTSTERVSHLFSSSRYASEVRLFVEFEYGGYGEMAQKVIEGVHWHMTGYAFEIEMAQNSNHPFFLYFLFERGITCLFAEVAHFF